MDRATLEQRLLGFVLKRSARMSQALRRKIARDFLMKSRPDDIFVVAHPGSGDPLLRMMLYQLTTDGSLDFPHIESVAPAFSFDILISKLNADEVELLEALPSPRVFYTHDLYAQRPRTGRFVYLVRNVKDVALALFEHDQLILGVEGDLDFHLEFFLSGQHPSGSWFEHTRSWWPHRHDRDVLFLVYDEVVADLEGTVCKLAEFCDVDAGERLPRIVERCRLDFLEQHHEKFDPRLRRVSSTPEGRFIRKGKAGGGRGAFNARQEKLLEKKIRALTRRLGDLEDGPAGKLLRSR